MIRFAWVGLLTWIVLSPAPVIAGPAEDANAAVDRWSAAYTGNDHDTIVPTYRPDAVLLGTVSPIMSEGTEAIRTYFSPLKGSGNKNEITERRTFVLSDSAVVVAGFYRFTRMTDGKPVPAPSRFTMLLTKRGNEWAIAHHILRHTFSLSNEGPGIASRGLVGIGARGRDGGVRQELAAGVSACPLLGVKRTWLRNDALSASDPKRT